MTDLRENFAPYAPVKREVGIIHRRRARDLPEELALQAQVQPPLGDFPRRLAPRARLLSPEPHLDSPLQKHLGKCVDHANLLRLLCNSEIWYRSGIARASKDEVRDLVERRADKEELALA